MASQFINTNGAAGSYKYFVSMAPGTLAHIVGRLTGNVGRLLVGCTLIAQPGRVGEGFAKVPPLTYKYDRL